MICIIYWSVGLEDIRGLIFESAKYLQIPLTSVGVVGAQHLRKSGFKCFRAVDIRGRFLLVVLCGIPVLGPQ